MKTIFRTDRSEKLLNEAYEKTLNEWAVKYKSLYIDMFYRLLGLLLD